MKGDKSHVPVSSDNYYLAFFDWDILSTTEVLEVEISKYFFVSRPREDENE